MMSFEWNEVSAALQFRNSISGGGSQSTRSCGNVHPLGRVRPVQLRNIQPLNLQPSTDRPTTASLGNQPGTGGIIGAVSEIPSCRPPGKQPLSAPWRCSGDLLCAGLQCMCGKFSCWFFGVGLPWKRFCSTLCRMLLLYGGCAGGRRGWAGGAGQEGLGRRGWHYANWLTKRTSSMCFCRVT